MDPCFAARCCVRFWHVYTQLRKIEHVAAADWISADDRESERTHRGHDSDVLSTDREINDESVRLETKLDLDVR